MIIKKIAAGLALLGAMLLGVPAMATTLYSNNFDSNTVGALPSGWTAMTGTWAVSTSGSVTSPNALADSSGGNGDVVLYTGGGSTADGTVSFTTRVGASGAISPGILFRFDAAYQNGYFIGVSNSGGGQYGVSLYKRVSGSYTQIPLSNYTFAFAPAQGDAVGEEVRFVGSTIEYRIWDITSGQTRPTSPAFTTTDTTKTTAGYGGVYAGASNTPPIDDFAVADNGTAAATAITTSVPTTGTVGTASTITATANGSLASNVIVTWSDNGAGGAFNPATTTLTSTSTSGTAQYTPANAGSASISETNNGGLTNAAASPMTVSASSTSTIGRNAAGIYYAPYVWNDDGTSRNANSTGSYVKFSFTGTSLGINLVPLTGLSAYPVVRAYIDNLPAVDVQLVSGQGSYSFATGLASGTHQVRIAVPKIDEETGCWTLANAVKIVSYTVDNGASVSAPAIMRPKLAIIYGDSRIQGVRDYGTSPVYPTGMDGTVSVAPMIAESLGAELGQVGYGGQGFEQTGTGSQPGLLSAYNLYSSGVSRLTGGVLSPAPDYVISFMGGNGTTTQSDVATFIANARAMAPNAWIIMSVDMGGFTRAQVTAATNAAIAAGDTKLKLIDAGVNYAQGINGDGNGNVVIGPATEQGADGVHPWVRTNARLAAEYTRQIQAAIDGSPAGATTKPRYSNGFHN